MKQNLFQNEKTMIRTTKLWYADILLFVVTFILFQGLFSGEFVLDDTAIIVTTIVVGGILFISITDPCYEILCLSEKCIQEKHYFILRPPLTYEIKFENVQFLTINYNGTVKGRSSLYFHAEQVPSAGRTTLNYKNDALRRFVTKMIERVKLDSSTNTLPFKVIDKGSLLKSKK